VTETRKSPTTTATSDLDDAHAFVALVIVESRIARRAAALAIAAARLAQWIVEGTLRCAGQVRVAHLVSAAGLFFASASGACELSEVNLSASQTVAAGVAGAASLLQVAACGALPAAATSAASANCAGLAHAVAASLTVGTAVGARACGALAIAAWATAILSDAGIAKAASSSLAGRIGTASATGRAASEANAPAAAVRVRCCTAVTRATSLTGVTAWLWRCSSIVGHAAPVQRHLARISVHPTGAAG
jgi:hypothetical protein